jgi:hypothetical protein
MKEYDDSLAAGRMAYDGERERDCWRDRETLDCVDLEGQPSCFGRSIEGLVPSGGDCFARWECGDEHYCAYDDACPGRCAPRAGAGEACPDGANQCDDGMRCLGDPERRCVVPTMLAEGEVCDQTIRTSTCEEGTRCQTAPGKPSDSQRRCRAAPGAGEPCDSWIKCDAGLVCVVPLKITDPNHDLGVCRTEAAEGETCEDSGDCAAGLRCVDDGYSTMRRRCARPLASGAECTGLTDYRIFSQGIQIETACPAGERCLPDTDASTSHCGPARRAGEHCSALTDCADGLFCNESERCEKENQRGEGQPCPNLERYYCAEGLYCSGEEICERGLGEGEACARGDRCAKGLVCRFGQCRANCG